MPGSNRIYIDTSVLVKWLVIEPYSEQVVQFFNQDSQLIISDLVDLECRCTMMRLQRSAKITEDYRLKAEQALAQQISDQWFEKVTFSGQVFREAKRLIDEVSPLPLRSLDAVHLSIVQSGNITQLATADFEMRQAAQALGLTIHYFNK